MSDLSAIMNAARAATGPSGGRGAASAATEAIRSPGAGGLGGVGGGPGAVGGVEGGDFSDVLAQAIKQVDGIAKAGDAQGAALVGGEDVAVHNVMAAMTRTELTIQLTTTVTAKALSAYQEIWRMDV